MRRLVRPAAALIRLAGGEPASVLPLMRALGREARGQRHWAHAREGGGGLGPDGAWWLTLAILVLVSGGLAMLTSAQAALAPWRAALVLLFGQFAAVMLMTARDAVPLLLEGADRRVIGWWPVRERDLLLARSGLLLRRVVQVSVAIAGLPWLVLALTGSGGVAVALGALVALGLHGLVLASLLALTLHVLGRLVGVRWARRLVEVLGVLLLLGLSNLGGRPLMRLLVSGDAQFSWELLVWPFVWFAAWTMLWPPQAPVVLAILLSLVASAALPAWGLRRLGRVTAAEHEQPGTARRVGRDWTGPMVAWASLWLRGRDGASVLLLLRAHLRKDWRLTGQLLVFPTLLVGLFWLRGGRLTAADMATAQVAAALAGEMAFFTALLGLSLAAAMTFSGEAPAAWLVHGAALDGSRLLSLHRRLVRALVTVPFVAVALGMLLGRGDLSLSQAPLALLLGLLAGELACVLVQWVRPAAPFSRAWRRGESAGRQVTWLLILVWPAHVLWQELVLNRLVWGLPLSVGAAAGLLVIGRWLLARRAARLGVHGHAAQVA